MTDHEALLRALRPLRPGLEDVVAVAWATADPLTSVRLAKQLIIAAIDHDFSAISRAARKTTPAALVGAGR